MGAWGVGLFSDDTALDVKSEWQELYKRFGEPEGTTRELLANYDADDADEGPVVILALAMCQWKYGCLQADIKARALEVIRTGAGLHLWEDTPDLAKRKAVYAKVAEAIQQPQPARKQVRKLVPLVVTPYKRGQLLKYRCWDGEYLLLWVVGECRYKGDVLPLCAALDWKGSVLPSRREILALRPVFGSTDAFNEDWMREISAELGEPLPRETRGLKWSRYAPREPTEHGFDMSRVEVVPGEWHWELRDEIGGPQVPAWIEVGPLIAKELSATVAFRRTLPLTKGGVRRTSKVLPARPRPLAPPLGRPRPLGVEVELPEGRSAKHSELMVLKRSKHQPVPGDIFVVNVKGARWVVGRVILTDGHFSFGPADILVYFYRQQFKTTAEIELPMRLEDLVMEPCTASRRDWTTGEFFHIANVPLDQCELPARHIFGPGFQGYYVDAYGQPTRPPEADEVVGDTAVRRIGHYLAEALGMC